MNPVLCIAQVQPSCKTWDLSLIFSPFQSHSQPPMLLLPLHTCKQTCGEIRKRMGRTISAFGFCKDSNLSCQLSSCQKLCCFPFNPAESSYSGRLDLLLLNAPVAVIPSYFRRACSCNFSSFRPLRILHSLNFYLIYSFLDCIVFFFYLQQNWGAVLIVYILIPTQLCVLLSGFI